MKKKIVVFGSFVVDLMSRASHLPTAGETVKGTLFKSGPGGKGFNQCVAAKLLGADVEMITKLGKDDFSKFATEAMDKINLSKDKLLYSDEYSTGAALIMVDEKTGQNQILVVSGACDHITVEEVNSYSDLLKESDYLLTQLETNMSSIERMVDLAYENNVKVILNTAPVQPISDELLSKIDIITPNEVEAQILTGIKVDSKESADLAAKWFFERKVKNVLITLGSRGVYVNTGEKSMIIDSYKVNAIDCTGAGDAYNGGFVASLAEGNDIWYAAKYANAVGALSTLKIGTTPAMPNRITVDKFIKDNN